MISSSRLRLKFFGLFVSFSFLLLPVAAQRFGGNPPSLKWLQINTDTVRVIFPAELESDAKKIAAKTHQLDWSTLGTIGNQVKKINIVLQKNTVVSNAYVGLAPWRSEYYMTPMQNSLELGSLPWSENLVIHETRHVQQFMNFRKGLSKFAYIIAGQEGQALANSAAVPDWFFEGDAVFQETLVSTQGRGRLPAFFNGYRSLSVSGKQYSWMKLRNGSMKDYVPDHYQLGYLLVMHGRKKYGSDFWKDVTNDAARFKPLFYPFQGAIKRKSGVSYPAFVKDAFSDFHTSIPQAQSGDEQAVTAADNRYVQDNLFPTIIGRDSLLVLRRTYRDIPAWWLINGQNEQKLFTKDIADDDYYSSKNGWIVYTSYKTDPRWAWLDYSDIFLVNIKTKKRSRLTSRSKYFSPDLSFDGEKIVAVQVIPGQPSSLHLLATGSGKLIRTIPNPKYYFHTYPVFSSDDKKIFSAVRNAEGRMAIIETDLAGSAEKILVPFGLPAIAFLKVKGDDIIFTASHNRKDEIWKYNLVSGQVKLLVSDVTGSYQADIDNKSGSIYYSRFTAEGYQIYRQKINPADSVNSADWSGFNNNVFSESIFTEQKPAISNVYADTGFNVSRYRAGKHLFNFHSWRPYYEQPEWSFNVYSQNILNTFRTNVYYLYNENEGYNKFGIDGSFAALYPWLTGGLSYIFDRKYSDTARSILWNEFNSNIGFRLPFNFSGARYYKYLSVSGSFNNTQLYFSEASKPKPGNYAINYLQGAVSFTIQSQQARQHIFPRYAFTFFAQQKLSVDDNAAKQLLLSSSLYLPGIAKTHNLVINAAWQGRDTLNKYRFSNSFPLSRGYPALDFDRMWKLGGNYHLPLVYPDFGIAQIVYFLRIRANVFYDASWVKTIRTDRTTALRSVGTEIYFDTKWWNQQSVSFGFRYSRLLDNDVFTNPPGANQWEFILPVGLFTN